MILKLLIIRIGPSLALTDCEYWVVMSSCDLISLCLCDLWISTIAAGI